MSFELHACFSHTGPEAFHARNSENPLQPSHISLNSISDQRMHFASDISEMVYGSHLGSKPVAMLFSDAYLPCCATPSKVLEEGTPGALLDSLTSTVYSLSPWYNEAPQVHHYGKGKHERLCLPAPSSSEIRPGVVAGLAIDTPRRVLFVLCFVEQHLEVYRYIHRYRLP